MESKVVSIVALVIGSWLIIPSTVENLAHAKMIRPMQNDVQAEFNLLLARTSADSTTARLMRLREFLEAHADFEPVYHALLEQYLYSDRLQEAKAYFQQHAAISSYSRNSYWMLARLFIRENNSQEALQAFTQALKIGQPSLSLLQEFVKFDHQQPGRPEGTFHIRQLNLKPETQEVVSAFYHYYKLEYAKAIEGFKKTPQRISQNAIVLHLWGNCAYSLSRYTEADSLWYIGLKLSSQNNDLQAKSKFLLNIGFLQLILLKHDLALSYYDSAYSIAKHINDYYQIQLLDGYRAYLNQDLGNYMEAKKQFEEAIQIALKIGEQRQLGEWYGSYAMTIYYLGNYTDALHTLDKSEEFAREANNLDGILRAKLNKATVYVSLKQHTMAKKALHDVFNLAEANNLRYHQKLARAQLGEILLLEGQYTKAREYYQDFINYLNADERLRKDVYWWIGRVARAYMLEQHYAMAHKTFLQALTKAKEAGSKTFEGWYLLRIATLELRLGNFHAAMKNYELAREIALAQNNTEMLWEILLGYGNAYKKMGNLREAIVFYERAAHIVEQTRGNLKADQLRIGYFIEGYQAYQNLINCFLQQYEKSDAPTDLDSLYYYVTMGRARALKDLKRSNQSGSSNEEYQQTCKQLRVLQRR
ncbi:hypothetical protein L0244_17930, partial [bacterium]|nr:hypothetical protein [bacterium]